MILHMQTNRTYIAIDLKSFYASCECQERGLDALKTNLVVADASKTDKTICLAVSPSLKKYGISGRARLFEVRAKVKEINAERARNIQHQPFRTSSMYDDELKDPYTKLDFLIVPPRMATYIAYSSSIYEIYLRYIAKDDIHVYSIDEVFIDATDYLKIYHMNAHDFARELIQEVLKETGITATAGIASNLYLCKCAMDIVAKHIPADKDGVRIAELDEYSYRKLLWTHRPLTDFWRVGKGIAKRLENAGILTMGDIARCSVGKYEDEYNEDLLYQMFGINAELLIDHAWGIETCTLKDIKAYRPSNHSCGIGQVLSEPYTYEKAKIIVKEMCEQLSLKLMQNHVNAESITLTVGYDISSMTPNYTGEVVTDGYGRELPKSAHGSYRFDVRTSTTSKLIMACMKIYEAKVNPSLLIRRITLSAANIKNASFAQYQQTSLFDTQPAEEDESEKKAEEAILKIKKKYGKNAVLKGIDLTEGATTKLRNAQIGGHKA